MFDRFSEDAREVMRVAKEQVRRFHHEQIDTEHLLLGLLKTENPAIAELLKPFGTTTESIQAEVERRVKPNPEPGVFLATVPFTSNAKRTLELCLESASRLDDRTIRTEHLLIGLIREPSGLAGRILAEADLDAESIERRLADQPREPSRSSGEGAENASDLAERSSPTPALDSLGIDRSTPAALAAADPCIQRDAELAELFTILSRRQRGNALLVGASGVGKTRIVQGLAARIDERLAPPRFAGHRVITLDKSRILGGSLHRGEFEARIYSLFHEALRTGRTILVLENLVEWIGASRSSVSPSGFDAAFVLRSVLDRYDVRCIGTATPSEYRAIQEKEESLSARFQPLVLESTGREATLAILSAHSPALESHHGVRIDDSALAEAYASVITHAPDRGLPGAALDLLDFAASSVAQQTRRHLEDGGMRANRDVASANPSPAVVQASDVREAARRMLPALTKANRAKG